MKQGDAVKLTTEEEALVLGALSDTWQVIGYDCLQATSDDGGGKIQSTTMSRAHVIEVVLDAGYLEMYGTRSPERKAAVAKFRALSYDRMKRIARKAFTYSRYGM